jgi:hypothetical protein
MADNELMFILRMRDEATAILKQHGAAMGEAAGQAKGLAAGHKEAASSLDEVARQAKEAGEALVALWASNEMARGAIEAYEATEKSIRQIEFQADASREAVEALHESLVQSAETTGAGTGQQLMELSETAARLGASVPQMKQFAEAVRLVTTDQDYKQVGDGIAQVMRATQEGVEGTKKFTDALAAMAKGSREGVDGLVQMTQMITARTQGLNMDSETTLAYAKTLESLGGQPRMSVMMLSMALLKVHEDGVKGGEAMDSLAERVGTSSEKMRALAASHPEEAFDKILQVVAKMRSEGTDPTKFLQGLGLGMGRELSTIEGLADRYQKLQANKSQAQGATDADAQRLHESLTTPFTEATHELETAWDQLKEDFGADITGPVAGGFKALASIIETVDGEFKSLDPATRGMIETLLIGGTAAAGLRMAFGLLGGVLPGIASALGLVRTAEVATAEGAALSAEGVRAAGLAAVESATATEGAAMGMAAAAARFAGTAGLMIATVGLWHEAYEQMVQMQGLQEKLGNAGVTWGDELVMLRHGMPSWMGGISTEDRNKYFQDKKNRGEFHPENFKSNDELEQSRKAADHDKELTAMRGQAFSSAAATQGAKLGSEELGTAEIEKALAGLDAYIKKTAELKQAQKDLDDAVSKMTDDQKQQYASSIAAAQREIEIRRQALDPMNKMRDSWQEQLQAAQAYTKAEQDQAAIEKAVAEQRRSNPRFTASDESEMRASMAKVQDTQRAKSFQDELVGMQNQLALAGALTNADKERLQIDQQLAALAKDKGYSEAELDQLRQVLELTKQIEHETEQFKSLNPQAEAIRNYNEQLQILNQRLAAGSVSQAEFNRERAQLDNSTLEARDPVGAIVQSQQEEIQQLGVVGQYREADLKSLQEITKLKKEGVIADDASGKAIQDQITGNNRMIQDIKDMQGQLDSLTQDFGTGLSHAIGSALNGQKYAFDKFFASLGQKMMDQSFSYLSKQMEGSLTGEGGPLSGLFGKAKQGTAALGGLSGSQIDKTMTIASATMTANSVIVNGAVSGAGSVTGAATAAGAPTALPASGTPVTPTAVTSGPAPLPSLAAPVQSIANPVTGIGSDYAASARNLPPKSAYGDLSAGVETWGKSVTMPPLPPVKPTEELNKAMTMSGLTPETQSYLAAHAGRGVDTAHLNPAFASETESMMKEGESEGMHLRIGSGARSIETQNELYQNMLAKKSGRPAPYPNQFSPDVAAPPGGSYHNFGNAADIYAYTASGAHDPAAQRRLDEIAREKGLTPGTTFGDQGHFQIAGPKNQGLYANGVGNAMTPDVSKTVEEAKKAQEQTEQALKATTAQTSTNLSSLGQGIGQLGNKATSATPGMTSLSGSIDQMLGSLTKGMGAPTGGSAGGGGGGLLGGLFSGLFSLFHDGGSVGSDSTVQRAFNPAIFIGAPRFHDGLGDDEFPAVLQRGERVLTAQQDQRATALMSRMADMLANTSTPAGTQHAEARAPSSGPRMTMIVNTPNASSFRYSQSQIMAQTHASLQRMGAKHN